MSIENENFEQQNENMDIEQGLPLTPEVIVAAERAAEEVKRGNEELEEMKKQLWGKDIDESEKDRLNRAYAKKQKEIAVISQDVRKKIDEEYDRDPDGFLDKFKRKFDEILKKAEKGEVSRENAREIVGKMGQYIPSRIYNTSFAKFQEKLYDSVEHSQGA